MSNLSSSKGMFSGKLDGLITRSAKFGSARSEMSASTVGGGPLPDASMAVHAGWLLKKGEGLMAKSQQRWFVIYRTGEMHYFERQWSTEAQLEQVLAAKGHKGLISLAGVRAADIARTKPSSPTDFTFCIATPKRKWMLTASSQGQFDAWHKNIVSLLGDEPVVGSGRIFSGKM